MFDQVVPAEGGISQPGANVSDRNSGWKRNFRIPDILIVLDFSKAIDRGTHWQGGPDFLVEIESPGDDTWEKLPFYAKIGTREVLIVNRDSRELTLLRLRDGELIEVEATSLDGKLWLCYEVVPLAFRRLIVRQKPRTVVRRTDDQTGEWKV